MAMAPHVELPKLYKRDSKGNLREWSIVIFHFGSYSEYCVTHGQKDGKLQEESRKITEGKHLGTKAETTIAEQAESEARAKWLKQKQRRGYSETAEAAGVKTNVKPMLAKVYFDEIEKVDIASGNWVAQPKFNGFRLLCFIEVRKKDYNFRFVTRNGVALSATVSHIHKQLATLLSHSDNTKRVQSLVLDGELYRHGWDLQKIASRAKKYYDESQELCYRVYDCFYTSDGSSGLSDLSFLQRYALLKKLWAADDPQIKNVMLTLNERVKQVSDILTCRDKMITQGYEGAMLRNLQSPYVNGARSSGLLKVKEFYDAEFEVIGFKKSVRDEAIFVCRTDAGAVFDVLAPGPRKTKVKLYAKAADFIGKKLQVQYAEWTNSDPPKPFHGVSIGFPGIDWEEL